MNPITNIFKDLNYIEKYADKGIDNFNKGNYDGAGYDFLVSFICLGVAALSVYKLYTTFKIIYN
jgi:hypothetical protein